MARILIALVAAHAAAAEKKPVVSEIQPRGLEHGTTARVHLTGSNLVALTKVTFANTNLNGRVLSARTNAAEIEIVSSPSLARGAYEFSVASTNGESGKLKLFVDDLPQLFLSETNPIPRVTHRPIKLPKLPVSVWSALEKPGDVDAFEFEAASGETIVIDLGAKQIGSKIVSGELVLLDSAGRVVAENSGFDGGDPLLAFTLKQPGRFTVRVADRMAAGSKDHFYRLSVGTLPYVTGVFPLGVSVGATNKVQLIGWNLEGRAPMVEVKPSAPAEIEVPIESEKFRARRAFKVIASAAPEAIEAEPNDSVATANAIQIPGAVNGCLNKPMRGVAKIRTGESLLPPHPSPLPQGEGATSSSARSKASVSTRPETGERFPLSPRERAGVRGNRTQHGSRAQQLDLEPSSKSDTDVFRFHATAGRRLVLETQAASRGSPADTKIEILNATGNPVRRLKLQAVRDSAINFRAIDSNQQGARLDNWEEMDLNNFIYMSGDVMRLFRMPQGPDSDLLFFASAGKRRAWFDTTATGHALEEPCYVVETRGLEDKLVGNGLPVFTLFYSNDDDGERKLGSDSKLYFTAPASGDYFVRVTDSRGFSGDRFAYRLVVRDAKPDFMVTLNGANPTVPRGSGQSFSVTVDRLDGFEGKIRVDITNVPPGFIVSTPLLIEAGQSEAKGTVFALTNAISTTTASIGVSATALVDGKEVAKQISSLGQIKVGSEPKLFVAFEPITSLSETNIVAAGEKPFEITIAPGQTVPARLKIRRNGHKDLVTFQVENLPFGVIVDNIGLNGVLIPKEDDHRQIFLTCAKWVADQNRLCYAIEQNAGRQTSRPLLLKIGKATQTAAK